MLIDPDGQGTRNHWDLTAHDSQVGVILHVLYAERDKTLHGCLTLLADPERAIETTLSASMNGASFFVRRAARSASFSLTSGMTALETSLERLADVL